MHWSPPPLRQGEPSHSTLLGGLHLEGPSILQPYPGSNLFSPHRSRSLCLPWGWIKCDSCGLHLARLEGSVEVCYCCKFPPWVAWNNTYFLMDQFSFAELT